MRLTCLDCGGEFERSSVKGMAPRYCSTACRNRAYRNRHPERMKEMGRRRKRPPRKDRQPPKYELRPCSAGCGRMEPSAQTKGRQCDDCRRLARTAWTYGITVAEVRELRRSACRICGAKPGRKAHAIDHCHRTNRVRGALCEPCNRGIGLLGEDIERLERAILYLKGGL